MRKAFSFSLVLLLLAVSVSASFAEEGGLTVRKAKNAVLFIGDGMGVGAVTLFLNYENFYKKQSTILEKVMRDGRVALCLTQPLENLVPECSSAGTAMATGEKTNLLRVSEAADGSSMKTILEYAQEAGKATGIVTTQRVSHSTPAVFSSHVPNRSMEAEIAAQQAKSNLTILLGGGMEYWIPQGGKVSDVAEITENLGAKSGSKRKDDENLIEQMKGRGYSFVSTAEALNQTKPGDKVLGMFSASHLPPSIDQRNGPKGTSPTLSEMTQKALELLSSNENGFVLVVEQGALDQIAHENDAAGTIAEMQELDRAVGIVMDFVAKNPDTLVLIASDHDTGGLTLSAREDKTLETENDYGVPFDFAKLELQKASSNKIFQEIGDDPSSTKIRKVIGANTAYDITEDEAIWIKVFPVDSFFPKYGGKPYGSLGKIIGNKTGIVWVSQYHTFAMVPLIGIGPGSELIAGLQDTTSVFHILKRSLSL